MKEGIEMTNNKPPAQNPKPKIKAAGQGSNKTMNKSVIEVLTETLEGKKIYLYRYSARHQSSPDREIRYHYVNEQDIDKLFPKSRWNDTNFEKIEVEIIRAEGSFAPYEGNDVGLTVKLPTEKEVYIHLEVELKLEFV